MRPHVFFMAALLVAPTGSVAQYRVEGLALSFRGHGASWKLDDVETSSFDQQRGGGAGAEVSFGMSDLFGLFGRIDLSSISPEQGASYTLTHFDVGARMLPSVGWRTIRPYVEAAFTARSAEFAIGSANLEVSGPAATAGLGFLAFVAPKLAIGLGAAGSFGNMTEVTFGDISIEPNVKATSFRGSAALVWFP